MRASIVGSSLLVAAALAGCATTGTEAPARVASASASECKAVTVYTGSQSIRNSVRGTQASARARGRPRPKAMVGLSRKKVFISAGL